MDGQEISRQCVRFATGLQLANVSEATREHAKQCLLDWLGCAIRGAGMPQAEPVKRYVDETGGNPQAQILGRPLRSSAYQAALSNGYFGHILEMDDVDKQSISHPGTVVISSALSSGEQNGASGADFLVAMIAGYEVMLRVGAAVTPAHYQIWHTTATTGVFGSVVAAGRLLGLNPEQMTWAFGNAGTMSAGLWEFLQDGAMSKYLHAGKAAASGVMAASFARHGLSGASRILEGKQGFFAGYARQKVDPAIFADFDENYRLDKVSFKPYPCCRHTHSAIDCALDLHRRCGDQTDAIRKIELRTYKAAAQVAGNENPTEARQAQFSLKYVVAAALKNGRVTLDEFAPEMLADSSLRSLMGKATVQVDAALDALTPDIWPAKLTVSMMDGTIFESSVEYPKGDPENPLTWEEVIAKFEGLTTGILTREGCRKVVGLCRDMENMNHCGELIKEVNAHAKF